MPLKALSVKPSRSEQAYEAIKEAIQSLVFRPGEFLAIGNLADQLEISRTPVRDALIMLEHDGLVRMVPQKGVYVSEITVEDIRQMYELRIVLERYAIRVATGNLTQDELDSLEKDLEETKYVTEQGGSAQVSDSGRRLHDILVQKVANKWITSCLEDLDIHYARIRGFAAIIPGRLKRSQEEHRKILTALKKEDADSAEKALIEHLTSVREEILLNIAVWMDYMKGNVQTEDPPLGLFSHLSAQS